MDTIGIINSGRDETTFISFTQVVHELSTRLHRGWVRDRRSSFPTCWSAMASKLIRLDAFSWQGWAERRVWQRLNCHWKGLLICKTEGEVPNGRREGYMLSTATSCCRKNKPPTLLNTCTWPWTSVHKAAACPVPEREIDYSAPYLCLCCVGSGFAVLDNTLTVIRRQMVTLSGLARRFVLVIFGLHVRVYSR